MQAFVSQVKSMFSWNPGFTALLHKRMDDEVEYDFSDSDLEQNEIDVPTKNDLPLEGKSKVQYRTLDDMCIWSWSNGKYVEYNPYSFGITQTYNESKPAVLEPQKDRVIKVASNMVFEDERQLAGISIDDVRKGADERLALVYNIDAFREDIRTVTGLKISFDSMINDRNQQPYFKNDKKQNILDNWFFQNHSALHLLLRSSCRSADNINANMLDAINNKGAHLWWDEKAGNAKFKDGEFEVNL